MTRQAAIEKFGVTYLLGDSSTSPIHETLGLHAVDPDPLLGRATFRTLDGALSHAAVLAAAESNTRLAREASDRVWIEDSISTPSARFRLWLARNWPRRRTSEIGILATESLLARDAPPPSSAGRSPDPAVLRLPDLVRLPPVLELDTEVVVLDLRNFPDCPLALRRDRIARRTVVAVGDHPVYDVVLRYSLAETPGAYSYDAPYANGRLDTNDVEARAFVDAAAAAAEIERLSRNLQATFPAFTSAAAPVPQATQPDRAASIQSPSPSGAMASLPNALAGDGEAAIQSAAPSPAAEPLPAAAAAPPPVVVEPVAETAAPRPIRLPAAPDTPSPLAGPEPSPAPPPCGATAAPTESAPPAQEKPRAVQSAQAPAPSAPSDAAAASPPPLAGAPTTTPTPTTPAPTRAPGAAVPPPVEAPPPTPTPAERPSPPRSAPPSPNPAIFPLLASFAKGDTKFMRPASMRHDNTPASRMTRLSQK
jgi:hypothetical protein